MAKVGTLELRIEVREDVVVNSPEGAIRPMFHSLVESPDDRILEVAATRVRRDDGLALRVR